MASLDPRLPVGDILAEPLRAHGVAAGRARAARRANCCELVGLQPGAREPLSRRRSPAASASASASRARSRSQPKLLVLDEPVSALDVSIRAGVINLLEQLKAELGLSYLFVAHDLSVVRHIADRVAVMYLGRIVEIGDVDEVFDRPAHPYTQALLSAIPLPDPRKERQRRRIVLQGDLPSPAESAVGLPVPHALPEVRGRARRRGAAAVHRRVAGARRAHRRARIIWTRATTRQPCRCCEWMLAASDLRRLEAS